MTNHPNRKKTYFTVRYGNHIAKFSSNRDAMRFAEAVSASPDFYDWQGLGNGTLIEVSHKSGLVGQYRNGKTTPEFQIHHNCRDNG